MKKIKPLLFIVSVLASVCAFFWYVPAYIVGYIMYYLVYCFELVKLSKVKQSEEE